MPTTVDMEGRRPDLVVHLKGDKQIVVVEQTCPWDSRLKEAYLEKWTKYHPLIADLKIQFPGWKVGQCTLVMGAMGSFEVGKYGKELAVLGLSKDQVDKVIANVQRATALGSIRVIKDHLAE